MSEIRVVAEAPVGAPPDSVYCLIADYRRHHPNFPPPAFSDLVVEQGGVGAGTVFTFKMTPSAARPLAGWPSPSPAACSSSPTPTPPPTGARSSPSSPRARPAACASTPAGTRSSAWPASWSGSSPDAPPRTYDDPAGTLWDSHHPDVLWRRIDTARPVDICVVDARAYLAERLAG